MNIKFNPENKKSIITIGIFLFVVIFLFQFIYFPKYKEVKKFNKEYKKLTKDISELYDFIGGQENLKDNIIKIREELVLLEDAFPFEKEVANVIRQLNEEAKRFRIKVVSLKPKNLEIYKDSEGRELRISDYFCTCMPLTLTIESRYQSLGKFLVSLETKKAPMISIEKVDIKKDENLSPRIGAKIDLTAYMLGK